jgi:hypothetical protein
MFQLWSMLPNSIGANDRLLLRRLAIQLDNPQRGSGALECLAILVRRA